jgi:hypothetical protein
MSCIRPTKFAHVVYRTRRFEQMLHWYVNRVQRQGPVSEPRAGFLDL